MRMIWFRLITFIFVPLYGSQSASQSTNTYLRGKMNKNIFGHLACRVFHLAMSHGREIGYVYGRVDGQVSVPFVICFRLLYLNGFYLMGSNCPIDTDRNLSWGIFQKLQVHSAQALVRRNKRNTKYIKYMYIMRSNCRENKHFGCNRTNDYVW